VHGRIILRRVLKKCGVRVWNGFNGLRKDPLHVGYAIFSLVCP
jgi:hypothetical protein